MLSIPRTAIRTLVPAIALLPVAALAQEVKLTRSAVSGVELLLVNERSWDANCKPLTTSVTITSQPRNGKATIVPGVSTIAVSAGQSGSTGRCAGTSVSGNQVRYRSNPGFRGTDSLGYKVLYGNGKSGSRTVTIDVR